MDPDLFLYAERLLKLFDIYQFNINVDFTNLMQMCNVGNYKNLLFPKYRVLIIALF